MFKSAVDPIKLDLFLEINELLNSSYADINSLFTKILESATRLTEGEASSLLLLNPETLGLEFVVALGSKGKEVKEFSLKKGEGIAGWVAENNCALVVHDVETDSRFFSEISKNVGFVTRSILAVPLRVKGTCVGVVEMINKKLDSYFTQEDQTWLEVFANQAGLALQNAKSFLAMQNELERLRNFVDQRSHSVVFVTQNKEMKDVLNLGRKFASTDSTVLIVGESGTGKELFADYIHAHSLRADNPLVKVNCAALPESLMESELFGHTKGAFTDAVTERIGKFELAQGGTLFLDEISEIPLILQAKLLRVIQTRSIQRIGGNETIKLDVRILVATNKNLQKEIEEGRFRADLYYRLNVLPIHLPPLRNRKEDIPFLTEYFLKEKGKILHKAFPSITSEAMEILKNKAWPGNVRELQNTIERALVLSVDGKLTDREITSENVLPERDLEKTDLRSAVHKFKKTVIQKALSLENGNQTKAAKRLRIQRTYLSKLMKELELEK